MKRTIATLTGVLLPLLLVVLLVGCGDTSDTTSSSAAGGSEGTGGAPTGEPIILGSPEPLTGPYAADGQSMQQAVNLAVDDINAAGGLLGRPVVANFFDIEDMAAEKMTAAADKLLLQDGASAIVTGYTNPGSGVSIYGKFPQPYLHFDGSQLSVDQVAEGMAKNPPEFNHVFMLGDVENPYGRMSFALLQELGYEFPNNKIAILSADFEWDLKVTAGWAEAAREAGWEVAFEETFPYGTREWGPQLTKIRSIDPAVIVISDLDAADQKTFLDQFAQDPTQSVIDGDYGVSIPQYTTIVGPSAEGVIGDATNSILPDEKGAAFKARWEEKYGSPPGLSIVGTVYDGVMMWAEAVKIAGDPDDYDAVAEAIRGLNYQGLNGTYAFDQYNKVPVSETMPMHTFQVQNGELKLIFLGMEKQADWILPPHLAK